MLTRLAVVFAGAVAAWGLWLAEVRWVRGWEGPGFNWSVLPICALLGVLSSYMVAPRAAWPGRTKFVGFGFVLTVAAFVAARWAAIELLSGSVNLRAAIILPVAGLAVSAGLTAAANRWLVPVHGWTGFVVAAALLLVLPCSVTTVHLLPAWQGGMDEIHSIQMGYPVFWTALLVPMALRVGRK